MGWETLRASVDLLGTCCQREMRLGFNGGEPLLEAALLRRGIEYARQVLSAACRRVRLHVTTNGVLLDPELAAFLSARSVDLRLSLDGVAAAQDRRGLNTAHRLDALLDTLHHELPRFFDHHLEVTVTLTGANLSLLSASVGYLLRRGCRSIEIAPRLTPDADWSSERAPELDEQLARVRAMTLEQYSRTGLVPVTLFRRIAGKRALRRARGHCGAGRGDALAIDVDGRVTACNMLVSSYGALPDTPLGTRLAALQIGYLGDPDLGRRLAEYPARARATGLFDPMSRRHNSCRRCPARQECLLCPAAVAAVPDNDDPHAIPPLPCAFNRIVAKHRALFPVQPSVADIVKGRASPLPMLGDA